MNVILICYIKYSHYSLLYLSQAMSLKKKHSNESVSAAAAAFDSQVAMQEAALFLV